MAQHLGPVRTRLWEMAAASAFPCYSWRQYPSSKKKGWKPGQEYDSLTQNMENCKERLRFVMVRRPFAWLPWLKDQFG